MEKAPRDARGLVEFWADLYVLAPKEPARGNGAALFDVLNRGRKNVIQYINRGPQVADPTRSEEHTSELLSHLNLVCRLLLEKKKTKKETTRCACHCSIHINVD